MKRDLRSTKRSIRSAIGRVGRIEGTRELVFADVPYIVPYRVTPSAIEVLTVMHTAQKWPDGF